MLKKIIMFFIGIIVSFVGILGNIVDPGDPGDDPVTEPTTQEESTTVPRTTNPYETEEIPLF